MARLGDICNIQSGGTPSRSEPCYWNNGTIPWVKISDFDGKYLNKTEEYISEAGLNNSSAKIFPKGTILYTIFATLGEVCVLDIDAATNQAIAGLQITSEGILPDYLFYFLLSLKAHVNALGRGVAQNNINMRILRELNIPIPDITIQQKIILLLDQVDKLIALRKQQLDKLDELVKARFAEMFSHGFPKVKAEEVCTNIVDCPHATPKYTGNHLIYPAIRTSEIKNGQIVWSSMKYVDVNEYNERTKRLVPKAGDIVYAREGTYGDCVILPPDFNFCLGQRTMLFRPNTRVCTPEYLHQALRSDNVKRQADESNAGSTVPHVNVADAKVFTFSLPPIELQLIFDDFIKQVETTRLTIQRGLDKLEMMKKTLMQQYFE